MCGMRKGEGNEWYVGRGRVMSDMRERYRYRSICMVIRMWR